MSTLVAQGRASQALLEVYGLAIGLGGDWPEVVDQLRLDFGWFEVSCPGSEPDVEITVHRRSPSFHEFQDARARFVTPRNVVYHQDGSTVVDYFGRVLSVLDPGQRHLRVEGEDEQLVHEAAYHFLLSRVGAHLDARGLPRLHALALSGAQGAVAVLLPSGGGKSTLALRALRSEGVRLLSEDSPLMDRTGRLHPFPLRVGINAGEADDLPAEHLRALERMEFHPKVALDPAAFADRIESTPQPVRHLVIGRRSLGTQARLEPLPRWSAIGTLLREAVVGVGLYQGMEFVLQRGARDVLRQTRPGATRTACCAALLARARVWRLTLGRDRERNWEALAPLLR